MLSEGMRVFYDGLACEPRLDHPEGVAVHRDGSVWCGGEEGQIYRIEPDGSAAEVVTSTGGFCLGMAFDSSDNLYVCDMRHAAVFRVLAGTTQAECVFACKTGRYPLRIPNAIAIDRADKVYVSDSYAFRTPGPGIFRLDPAGPCEMWYREPLNFANGIALNADETTLYVAETFGKRLSAITIAADGSPEATRQIELPAGIVPDGLGVGPDGELFIACFEPSQVVRLSTDGAVSPVMSDPEAHELCHPTNIAFRGSTLFAANLGRWHITAFELGRERSAIQGQALVDR